MAAETEAEVSLSALDSAENHTATVLLDGSGRYHQLMFLHCKMRQPAIHLNAVRSVCIA